MERVGLDKVNQWELIFAETEEEVLFCDGLGGLAVGAENARRSFDEDFLTDGVLTGVSAEIDRAAVDQILEELLDGLAYGAALWISNAESSWVMPIRSQRAPDEAGNLVGKLLGGTLTCRCRRTLDLLAVLVSSGQQKSVVAKSSRWRNAITSAAMVV